MKYCLIVLLFLFIIAGLGADGVQPEGAGTTVDPYQVECADNLLWMSTHGSSLGAIYMQTSDIDLFETPLEPIGFDPPFTGSYNGQGYTVSNLSSSHMWACNRGLFGVVCDAEISNIVMQGVSIDGYDTSGGLIGYCENSVIENCEVEGIVDGHNEAGGMIGLDVGSEIINCFADVDVDGWEHVGGLIGRAIHSLVVDCETESVVSGEEQVGGVIGFSEYIEMSGCSSSGNVTGSWNVGGVVGRHYLSESDHCSSTSQVVGVDWVGGLMGWSSYHSILTDSQYDGSVTGETLVGGVVGNSGSSTTLRCSSQGSVTGDDEVGGLIGYLSYSLVRNSYSTSTTNGGYKVGGLVGRGHHGDIMMCYSTGAVSGQSSVGGLVGTNPMGDCGNSFWNTQTSLQNISAGGAPKTTSELRDVATYTSVSTSGLADPWDFVNNPFDDTANEDIWSIAPDVNDGYPTLNDPQTDIEGELEESPHIDGLVAMGSAYPNPFNPVTNIRFFIAQGAEAVLEVYNARGQLVKTFGKYSAGDYTVVWRGVDEQGAPVASGVYFSCLRSGASVATGKMVLLK